MSKLPKLKITTVFGYPLEEIRDIEHAKYLPFGDYVSGVIVVVEGQVIDSYEKLVQIAAQDDYKGKEFLEVIIAPVVLGGG